jgi:hypothetical protein
LLGGRTDFLCHFILSRDAIVRQRSIIKCCAELGKSATKTLAVIREAFEEESTSRTRKVQTHRGRKTGIQVKSKVKSMLIILFSIIGIVHKAKE